MRADDALTAWCDVARVHTAEHELRLIHSHIHLHHTHSHVHAVDVYDADCVHAVDTVASLHTYAALCVTIDASSYMSLTQRHDFITRLADTTLARQLLTLSTFDRMLTALCERNIDTLSLYASWLVSICGSRGVYSDADAWTSSFMLMKSGQLRPDVLHAEEVDYQQSVRHLHNGESSSSSEDDYSTPHKCDDTNIDNDVDTYFDKHGADTDNASAVSVEDTANGDNYVHYISSPLKLNTEQSMKQ